MSNTILFVMCRHIHKFVQKVNHVKANDLISGKQTRVKLVSHKKYVVYLSCSFINIRTVIFHCGFPAPLDTTQFRLLTVSKWLHDSLNASLFLHCLVATNTTSA